MTRSITSSQTKKRPPDANDVFENFTNALAALIEHPETPDAIYDAFDDAYTEIHNIFSSSITPAEEASEIRAKLPGLIKEARQRERRAKQ